MSFDNPQINREYVRWCKKIGVAEDQEAGGDKLSVGEVLRAHFLIAEFFVDENNGLGGIGPRDKNADLLQSALSRQFTGYGDKQKWTDAFDIAATSLFGLVKNHPFHDGNKRTALLSVLHLLEKQNYVVSEDKRKFETLVVGISENRYRRELMYQYLCDTYPEDDAAIMCISYKLKRLTRHINRSHRTVTYRQLNGLLKQHHYALERPNNNKINVVRIAGKQKKPVGNIGFPGMSRQVPRSELKKAREICNLSEADGYDSKAFFNGTVSMDFLLSEYANPLKRLADK